MAIHSNDACDTISSKTKGSSKYYKNSNLPSRLVKIDFATEGSICSVDKYGRHKSNFDFKSPYYSGDNVQLLSSVTEKTFVRKKATNIASPYTLSGKLYKANSDEFKASKNKKKIQKSVLTLPNEPAPVPQLCTVSDMNDSEYFNRNDDNRKKTKKRILPGRTRKCRRRKDLEFYDRDALYCSQMSINLERSSSDMIKKYNCDENNTSQSTLVSKHSDKNVHPHEVWAILRDINKFRFPTSPPMSDESIVTPKKKTPKRRNNRKDLRVIERCCTEEIAYISSYETKTPVNCISQSSSFDKITVIEKKNGFNKLCRGFEERITRKKKGTKLLGHNPKTNNKNQAKSKTLAKLNNTKETSAHSKKSDNREEKQLVNYCMPGKPGYNFFATEKRDNKMITHGLQHIQCQELMYSDRSNASKGVTNRTTNRNYKVQKQSSLASIEDEVEQQINGITKVVLNKDQTLMQPSKNNTIMKKPSETNVSTNSVIIPKLTKLEIQRLLKKQKYPIVVLGKDQLSSTTIKVINEEPTQFDGLNKQIWPFMRNWSSNNAYRTPSNLAYVGEQIIGSECKDSEKCKSFLPEQLQNNEFKLPKYQDEKRDNGFKSNHVKIDHKRRSVSPVRKGKQIYAQVKPKPMQQLKERMLKLLYKNSTTSVNEGSNNSDSNKIQNINGLNADNCKSSKDTVKPKVITGSPTKTKTSLPIEKRPWAKAKWASDFIENVIRKIKAGVYYTQDNKILNIKNDDNLIQDIKEKDTTPSVINMVRKSDKSSSTHSIGNESLKIPGFDDVLPAVEIKSMNMNEISVKHCITNIMVRFDVAVKTESTVSSKNSSSLIPVEVNDSRAKVFKCKTSIINSMLPAELCSILPNMLRSIAMGEHPELHPVSVKSSSQLSTITEVAQGENHVDRLHPIHSSVTNKPQSQGLCRLLNGRYLNTKTTTVQTLKKTLAVNYKNQLVEELACVTFKIKVYHLINCEVSPMIPQTSLPRNTDNPSVISSSKNVNSCTTVDEPYSVSDRRLLPSYKLFNITILFDGIAEFFRNVMIKQSRDIHNILTLTLNYQYYFLNRWNKCFTPDTRSRVFKDTRDKTSTALIEYVNLPNSSDKEQKELQCTLTSNNNITRRKGYVKLHKKCKSSSNISGEKPTSLNKITSIDDFFHAMGSGKSLSSVFDLQSGRKIMSSLKEMKNWTSEINPRQALLVLLLTNKKDSSNLLRYRPVLLQGIAVKRITKATELDMEIEVIERENLNTFSQYEGISYLPASVENQDTLFEELSWIAKTTASDYQRPFDENSEKLLKSLLEKRKKLNPSYLRVMARYVGLGLLKSPGKK